MNYKASLEILSSVSEEDAENYFNVCSEYIDRIDSYLQGKGDGSGYLLRRYGDTYKVIDSRMSASEPDIVSYYIEVEYPDMEMTVSLFLDLYPRDLKMDVKAIREYPPKYNEPKEEYSGKDLSIEDEDGRIMLIQDVIKLIDETIWE